MLWEDYLIGTCCIGLDFIFDHCLCYLSFFMLFTFGFYFSLRVEIENFEFDKNFELLALY